MRKIFAVLSLLALFMATYPADAEQSVHLSKDVSNRIKMEADIFVPEKQAYASYRYVIPDLTRNETLNENALADRLFVNPSSPRTHTDDRDENLSGRWGGNAVESVDGEMITVGQAGSIVYERTTQYLRYILPLSYILHGTNNPAFYMYGAKYTLDDFKRDHDYMTSGQAEKTFQDYIGGLNLGLDIRPVYLLSISHDQMEEVYRELLTKSGKYSDGYYTKVEDWNENDDLYAFVCGFTLEGLPVYDGLDEAQNRGLTVTTRHGGDASYLRVETAMNGDGVFYLSTDYTGLLSKTSEAKTIIGYEEAVTRLESYLQELIPPNPINISSGYLQYVPVPSAEDPYTWNLLPAWCFQSEVIVQDGAERKALPDATYCFSAFTGEELQ